MKKPFNDFGFPPFKGDIKDLEKLAGFSPPVPKKESASDQIAQTLASKGKNTPDATRSPEEKRLWQIHNLFLDLYEKKGKPFLRFLGDLLDILLTGPIQTRLVNDLLGERNKRLKKIPAAEPVLPESSSNKMPDKLEDPEIRIGGEPVALQMNFLKRKTTLASLFLESEEYPAFLKLMKSISEIAQRECPDEFAKPMTPAEEKEALEKILSQLKQEVTQESLLRAWIILEKGGFSHLDWVYENSKGLGLLRPTYYEDLDKAYREAKKLLKLLIDEFEARFPPEPAKKDAIFDYLKNILDVYTHHHFVVKHYNQTRVGISRQELDLREKEANARIENYKTDMNRLREEIKKLTTERDNAVGQARSLQLENEALKSKLEKLDPVEVEKQIKAMDAKMNLVTKENQATIEEDAELRTALRKMDAENQQLIQKLRDLHAIPDEQAKSVEGLLEKKRVVVFGGIGRDHYWPLLKEAGVKDADYEWYEGYHTISQSRTSEIVGRCDVVAVITSYAGHLLLWQTRNAIRPDQTHFLIHHSGAGSLRQAILDKFKKNQGGN